MLSICFSHVATVASSSRTSVFHFLAKLFLNLWDFLLMWEKKRSSCEKTTMKLSLLHKSCNTCSHRKSNLMALTTVYQFELWLKIRDMFSKLSFSWQGPWNLVWLKQVFELSEFELTEFQCTWRTHDMYLISSGWEYWWSHHWWLRRAPHTRRWSTHTMSGIVWNHTQNALLPVRG